MIRLGENMTVEPEEFDTSNVRSMGCIKEVLVNLESGLSKESTAASFVRPNRAPDKSRTFLEALRHKYAEEDAQEDGDDGFSHFKPAYIVGKKQVIRISGKEAQEIGFDKIRRQQSQLDELKIVLLDGLNVSQPLNGDDAQISKICPRITELDVSRNLFEELTEVAYICRSLLRLRELRIE
jgi:hypothetical protein